jgi:selenocysteine-specific elongation factor
MDLQSREFDLIIGQCIEHDLIVSNESVLRLSGFEVVIKPEEMQKAEQIIRRVEREPLNAPTLKEVEESIGPELLNALFAQKRLVRLSDQVLVTPTALKESTEWVTLQIKASGQVTAAELRDHLKASRKYAIAILEYLDETHVTRRVGDIRVLR